MTHGISRFRSSFAAVLYASGMEDFPGGESEERSNTHSGCSLAWRGTRFGSEQRAFKSSHPDCSSASVAQTAEQRLRKSKVGGSIPSGGFPWCARRSGRATVRGWGNAVHRACPYEAGGRRFDSGRAPTFSTLRGVA